MDFHGGTPRLYFKSLARYSFRKFRSRILSLKLFTFSLKVLERFVFRKATVILRDSFINKDLTIKAVSVPFAQQATYEVQTSKHPQEDAHDIQVFALYLPQYHPLKVNDEAWGEGFTEWTNVSSARPLFEGHSQPILPGRLGFYDLRHKSVIREQVLLAKSSGLVGFVVFIYWFGDYAIMDEPLVNIKEVCEEENFKFVFEWANEPWTRNWDGLDSEVILPQARLLTPQSAEGLVEHFGSFLMSPAYLKKDNSPVFFVYNPSFFNSGSREILEEAFVQKLRVTPFLIGMQTFETTHDQILDLGYHDSAEYFPHNFGKYSSHVHVKKFPWTVSVSVQDYRSCVDKVISSTTRNGIPSCFPSWDNSPRRKFAGSNVFINSDPAYFAKWLENSLDRAMERQKSGLSNLVLINAWNEWAEGTVLEPTRSSGYSYLNVVSSVIYEAD